MNNNQNRYRSLLSMKRIFHIGLSIFCLLCLLAQVACKSVYYNTFYNARQSYNVAEQKRKEVETPGSRLTPAVYRELYKRAIAKASAVLELYPKSKWVDDAILLIGKSFYWREEYSDALTKFQELQQNFPKSTLIADAIYWQGLTLWATGRIDDARVSLQLIQEETDSELFVLAHLALAELEAAENRHEEAVDAYHALLDDQEKNRDLRARAWQGVGNSLLSLNRYEEALKAYQNVLDSQPDTKTNFETRVQIGEALEKQGRFDEALSAYDQILTIKRLRIYEAETQLKQAQVLCLKNDLVTAEKIFDGISQKYPRSKYSAEAYYQMGLIAQQAYKDIEKAKDLFDKASSEDRNSDAGQAALQRQKDLILLERYQTQASDTKTPKTVLPSLFNLAELYLFNLGEPDSALVTYQRALNLADSTEFASKALYAIGLIYADSLKNEAEAHLAFQKLIDTYPNTPYASKAQGRLQTNRSDDVLAEARFLEIEAQKAEGVKPEIYVENLKQIVDTYPHSTFAPKALYAMAWTCENDLDQLDQARLYYEQVKDRYPMTPFGELSVEKLKGNYLKPPEPAQSDTALAKTPALSDTSSTTGFKSPDLSAILGSSDQEPLRASEVEIPPEVIEQVTPVYPVTAKAEGRPATVVVRVLVRKDGRVGNVEVLNGPDMFQSAAVMAAGQYRFKPAMHAGQPREVWMEVTVTFTPPD